MTVVERPGTTPRARAPRLDSLTSLRGLAASAIVVYHSWWAFTGWPDMGAFDNAYTAVGLFFMLSGVVLAWSWRPGTPARTQWRRRAARILPLHWVTLGAMVAAFLVWPATGPTEDARTSLLLDVALLQAWPPADHLMTYNFPSWSLSTEAFFYLLFPLLMWGLTRLSTTRLVLLAVGLVATYGVAVLALYLTVQPALDDRQVLALPPLQVLKFAAGACLGLALRRGWRPRVPLWAAVSLLLTAALLLPLAASPALPGADTFRGSMLFPDLVLVVPMLLVVVAAAGSDLPRLHRQGGTGVLGRCRPLVRLGEWSFALYLVHAPVLQVYYAWRVAHPDEGVLGPGWLVAYLLVCVAAAGLLHTVVEKPVERWFRRRERAPRTATTPVRAAVPRPRDPAPAAVPMQVPVGAPTP